MRSCDPRTGVGRASLAFALLLLPAFPAIAQDAIAPADEAAGLPVITHPDPEAPPDPTAVAPDAAPQDAPSTDDDEPLYPTLLETTLSVEGDLEPDGPPGPRRETALAPWFAWKQGLTERTGLTIGGSWGLLWQNYSNSRIDQQDAVGSKFTLNLSWAVDNRGEPDALMFDMAIEDRRPVGTDLPPLQAGIGAGSGVPTAATWGDFSLGVTQAYIRQNLAGNRFQYAVGKIFAPNFVNAYPFFDDNRQFLSLQFSTSPTIAVPLRGFGAVAAGFPTEGGLYLKGGIFTPYSDDTGWTVDDFFGESAKFYFFETGWSGLSGAGMPIHARGPMDRNNFHVTTWYRDALNDGSPRAYGVAFNANFMAGEDFMWFVRGGWSNGWLADANLSAGLGWRPPTAPSDLLGFAGGWTSPSNDFLETQYTAELFYRYHLTENFALTPVLQLVLNPSLYPTRDSITVLSVRSRITF
ncbi:carbohydrate porin [Brevundimonas lenta]|uniref:Carbohydrate-selective porin OprB n=1 Tax=Brevundimonas lenta TaxID=424796 RepID=A0A7W6NPA2_9CAUL|nr:carbohydrate porin [Brevundimonas lenta]MBB4081950.1 carbohydrate-selective porin OprB [Brevundimonas lenta]